MRVSQGSILDFTINLTIPANEVFERITIADTIQNGFTYTKGDAKIYNVTDGGYTEITTGFVDETVFPTPPADPTDPTEPVTVLLNINDLALVQPATAVDLEVVIPLLISDINALTTTSTFNLTNEAVITPYTAEGAGEPDTPSTTVPLTRCNLLGFGSSYPVVKEAGKDAILAFNFPAVNSMASTDLEYVITATLPTGLSWDTTNLVAKIYVEDAELTPQAFTIAGKTATLTLPHITEYKDNTVYVVMDALTDADVTSVTDPGVVTNLDLVLNYEGNPVCTPPDFTVTTPFQAVTPRITGSTKSIG